MTHPSSEFRSDSQTTYQTSKSLIPLCKVILSRWFSPLQCLIWSDNNELPKNDKQWKRFFVTEMVDDLFSGNPAIRAWALRNARQLMMDYPDRLIFNVIRIRPPRSRRWRLKRALASVILQFEHPIATFGCEFTPVLIAQLSYPDPESIRCVFDTWWDMDCWQHGELDCLVKLSVIKSIVEQTKRNASVTALRSLAELMRDLCCNEDPLPQEGVYEELIPALKYLIKQTDTEVLYHTALVIDSFVLLGNRQSGLLIDAGILQHLIPLISHSHSDLAFCAMQPVCHFTYGNMEEKQAVWDCGFLNHFPNMLRTGDKYACAWVLSCLSYLAAGNRELHCALLDWGLFPRIRNRADYEDIPALTVGSLMKYDNCREVPFKVNLCLVDCLSDDLSTAREDNSLELHALSKILSSAGGQLEEVKKRLEDGHTMQVVYALQWSVNDDESRLSYHIMEDYFG